MRRRIRWVATIAALGLVAVGVRLLDLDPADLSWFQRPDPGIAPGPPSLPDDAAALLIHPLPPDAARTFRGFRDTDWSLAWINVLEQEFGAASHLDAASLEAVSLDDRELVVISQAAARGIDAVGRSRLVDFALAGGVVVLDRPDEAWESVSGTRPASGPREARGISGLVPRGGVGAHRRDELLDLPLRTQIVPVRVPAEDAIVVLEIDALPAIIERRMGRGLVQTVTFDLPRALVAIQQGMPARDDGGVEKRFGKYDWLYEPEDLVLDARLLDNTVPYADLLEEFLAWRWINASPRARWWRFPGASPGAFLMTHDEDEQGAKAAAFLAEYEASVGATSTFFVVANRRLWDTWGRGSEGFDRIARLGADVEIHRNVLAMPFGIWKIEPVKVRYSFAYQMSLLAHRLGARPIANRTHYLIVGDHYTRHFRVLAKQGIRWDSTYGPNRGGRGYLFGTGLPFRPLDLNGMPFPFHELPFQTQEDWGGASPEFMHRLLTESAQRWHGVVLPILHPHLIVRTPEGQAFWEGMLSEAAEAGHWMTNFEAWDRFQAARARGRVRSRLEGGRLEIRFEAPDERLSLLVPQEADGRPLAEIRFGDRAVPSTPLRSTYGGWRVVPLPAASGTLVVDYLR